jgi:AcrR family transcriptional regulator
MEDPVKAVFHRLPFMSATDILSMVEVTVGLRAEILWTSRGERQYSLRVGDDDSQVALRERTRRAVRAEISQTAIRLFAEHGFDETTVEQIATEVGMSSRSVFRYFPTKEDMVVGHLYERGHDIAAELRARPTTETAWEAMIAALREYLLKHAAPPNDPVVALMQSRVMQVPALRAAVQAKHVQWEPLLVPEIVKRLPEPDATRPLRAQSIVAAALACLTKVGEEHSQGANRTSPTELLTIAAQSLR